MTGRLAASAQATATVLAAGPLRRAVLATSCCAAADWALTVVLGVVAFRDAGAAGVGLVGLARLVPSALVTPVVTALADRVRRERLLTRLALTQAVAMGATAAALASGAPPPAAYVPAVVATVAFTAQRPGYSALVPSLCVTTRELTAATVVLGLVGAAAAVLGPALAGGLLAWAGTAAVPAAGAGLGTLSAVLLLGVHTERPAGARAGRLRLPGEVAAGARQVRHDRDLRLVFAAGLAQTYARGALNVFTVVVALQLLGTGDPGVAMLTGAFGAGGVAGSVGGALLVGSRSLGRWLALALAWWGVPIAALAAAGSPGAAAALMFAVGVANAVIDVPFFTLPVRLAPEAMLGRVFGLFESVVAVGVALGSALTPLVIGILGLPGALVVTGCLLPALAVAAWPRLGALDACLVVRDGEIALLRAVPMLGLLPVATIEELAAQAVRRTVAAGADVVRQGDPGDAFYVITGGEADVIGDGVPVRRLRPGTSFGEIALVHDRPRTGTVSARTELALLAVDRDAFLGALTGHRAGWTMANSVAAWHLADFAPRES